MQISFVLYDRPEYCAGPIVNARRLLPELQRSGHDVSAMILYQGDHSPAADHLRRHNIECRVARRGWNVRKQIRWILQQVADVRPEVFVANVSVAGCYAAKWIRRAGIPTVAAQVSDDGFSRDLVRRFVLDDSEWTLSGLMSVSEELAGTVALRQPLSMIGTYCPGPPIPTCSANQEGPLRIAYLGRLEEHAKRVSLVLESVITALDRHGEMSALFIGDGNARPDLEKRVVDAGLVDRISFTGFVHPDDVFEKLADCHVLVLLSDSEGKPGAVLDAMATGVIPVCLDIAGGVRELVINDKTGFLVKDRQDDFQLAIDRLASDLALRKRLSIGAREHIQNRFSLAVQAQQWVTFFEELVANESNARQSDVDVPRRIDLPSPMPAHWKEDVRSNTLARTLIRHALDILRTRISRDPRP